MAEEKRVIPFPTMRKDGETGAARQTEAVQVQYLAFPGGMQRMTFQGKVTMRQVLERAGIQPQAFRDAENAVDNVVSDNLDTEVKDGATVTRTTRIEGGAKEI